MNNEQLLCFRFRWTLLVAIGGETPTVISHLWSRQNVFISLLKKNGVSEFLLREL